MKKNKQFGQITEEERWKFGGSHKKYQYTVKTIAEATGRAEGTVRNDVSKKVLDINNLVSISFYIVKYFKPDKGLN